MYFNQKYVSFNNNMLSFLCHYFVTNFEVLYNLEITFVTEFPEIINRISNYYNYAVINNKNV